MAHFHGATQVGSLCKVGGDRVHSARPYIPGVAILAPDLYQALGFPVALEVREALATDGEELRTIIENSASKGPRGHAATGTVAFIKHSDVDPGKTQMLRSHQSADAGTDNHYMFFAQSTIFA